MWDDDDMMKRNSFVDNQMSASERRDYEAGLGRRERQQALEEFDFQRQVEHRLRQGRGCPQDVWATLRTRLENEEKPPREPLLHRAGFKPLAIAALLLANLVLAVILIERFGNTEYPPVLNTGLSMDRSSFLAEGRFAGDWEKVCRCLESHGFAVGVAGEDLCRELGIELLGVRYQYLQGERVAQVMFRRNGRPGTVFIGTQSALRMRNIPDGALGIGLVAACRELGDYRLIALAESHPQALLDLFG